MAEIDDYEFGYIVIDGDRQSRDVIILPDRIVSNWWRRDGHSLVIDDLGDVIDELPEHLVIGSGAYGRMKPEKATIDELERRGVSVEVLRTADAVTRYAELDPSRSAAALHLTC